MLGHLRDTPPYTLPLATEFPMNPECRTLPGRVTIPVFCLWIQIAFRGQTDT